MTDSIPTVLARVADTGQRVTVDRGDRVFVGTVHDATESHGPGYFTIRSGQRGRPGVFHADDVVTAEEAA